MIAGTLVSASLVGVCSAHAEVQDFLRSLPRVRSAESDDLIDEWRFSISTPSDPRARGAGSAVAPRAAPLAGSDFPGSPAERTQISRDIEPEEPEDYDPWEPFNEQMFWFNHDVLDRFALKPVATVWD